MTRFKLEQTLFDLEIERTLRQLKKEKKKEANTSLSNMADQEQKALRDYAMPSVNGATSSIRRPAIQANKFEIKPAIIQMIQQTVQFGGLSQEDPNVHIANFLEICDTFKYNGVTDDVIRLRLFPFSLRDKAKVWLNSLPHGIYYMGGVGTKILSKIFPSHKDSKVKE